MEARPGPVSEPQTTIERTNHSHYRRQLKVLTGRRVELDTDSMPVEIKCREDIIKLPDIASLRSLKKQWNVENDGRPLKDREDYVRLLLDFFDRKGPGVTSNPQVSHAVCHGERSVECRYCIAVCS